MAGALVHEQRGHQVVGGDPSLGDKAAQGHPVRATVSDMGPLLLARMLSLKPEKPSVTPCSSQ